MARRHGLPSEIASALWQKGVRIRAFSAEIQKGQDIFHLAVDNDIVAKQTFLEKGWEAIKEGALARPPSGRSKSMSNATAGFVRDT
jgi:hypothetical protein